MLRLPHLSIRTVRAAMATRFALAVTLTAIASPAIAQMRLPPPPVAPVRASGSSVEFERAVGAVRYLVYIDSSSWRRLDRVQRLIPSASFGDLNGDTVIQIGLFEFAATARDRQELLVENDFDAEVIRAIVGEPEYTGRAEMRDRENSLAPGYYVIIPGNGRDLERLSASLRSLLDVSVQVRDEPYGSHVVLGMFPSSEAAEEVTEILRDRDVHNARVYYERGESLLEALF